jgi:hypothetical protein
MRIIAEHTSMNGARSQADKFMETLRDGRPIISVRNLRRYLEIRFSVSERIPDFAQIYAASRGSFMLIRNELGLTFDGTVAHHVDHHLVPSPLLLGSATDGSLTTAKDMLIGIYGRLAQRGFTVHMSSSEESASLSLNNAIITAHLASKGCVSEQSMILGVPLKSAVYLNSFLGLVQSRRTLGAPYMPPGALAAPHSLSAQLRRDR